MTVEWPPNTGPESSQDNIRGHLARCARSVEENIYYAPSQDHYFNLLQRRYRDKAPYVHLDAIFLEPEDELIVYLHKQRGYLIGLEVAEQILGNDWHERLMDGIDDLMDGIEGLDDTSPEQYLDELAKTSQYGWSLGQDFERTVAFLSESPSNFCTLPEHQDELRRAMGFVFSAIAVTIGEDDRLDFRDEAENYIRKPHLWDSALIALLEDDERQ